MLAQRKLIEARQTLMAHWNKTRGDWNDAVSRRFEQKYLAELDHKMNIALSAIDQIEQVIQQLNRDCE